MMMMMMNMAYLSQSDELLATTSQERHEER